jgi:hypothetical protein
MPSSMKPDDPSKTNLRINHLQIIRLNSKNFVCILSFPQLANYYYEHVVRVLHRYAGGILIIGKRHGR